MAVPNNDLQPGPYKIFKALTVVAAPLTIKATAGRVYEFFATNKNAASRFIKFYDTVAAPTIGTDIPVITLQITPTPNGQITLLSDMGWDFVNGIYVAATTAVADADTGAPSANDIVLFIQYK